VFIHTRPPLDEATLRTDYVALTHNHADHTWPESLLRIDAAYPETRYVGPPESVANMRSNGIPAERMITITAGERATIGSIAVHAIWSKPPGGIPEDSIQPPDVQHLGYVFEIGRVRVYISGDPVNTFASHESLLAPIRKLKPHIGLLTNHPSEGEFPFFPGSARIAVELGLDTAVPAHYQCFVSRNYDPNEWASHLPAGGTKPLIIPYNQSVVYLAPN
jgi:L-ascorbate metabolism protein UlaG (beta-lactamase superfamily)